MKWRWEQVKRVRDAEAAWCVQCERIIASESNPFWHWRKSQWLHEHGTGHTTIIVRLTEAAAERLSYPNYQPSGCDWTDEKTKENIA